jgi:hypothetical protein
LPLLYKVIGVHSSNYTEPFILTRLGIVQAILGWVGFAGLAMVVASRMSRPAVRWGAFLAIQLLGVSLHVAQWDSLLLSESLAASMLALTIAAWILLFEAESSKLTPLAMAGIAMGVFLVTALFSFTRDSNSYLLLGIGAVWLVLCVLLWRWDVSGWQRLALACAMVLAIFSLHQLNINASGRWRGAFYGTFLQRIYGNTPSREFFIDQGMPQGEWQEGIVPRMKRTVFIAKVMNDPAADRFNQWMMEYGRSSYAKYLISHPRVLLSGPVRNYQQLISPNSVEYRSKAAATPLWLSAITKTMFPMRNMGLALLLGIGIALVAISTPRAGVELWWTVPITFLALVPAQMLFIWHADSIEIERHAFLLGLGLRAGAWLLVLIGLDRIHLRGSRRKMDRPS